MCVCTEGSPLVCVGLDVAEATGWAVIEETATGLRLLRHGTAVIRGGSDVEQLVADIAPCAPALVGVEAPFVKPATRGGNPHSALELAALVGRFRQALDARGIRSAPVLASTWQTGILGCRRFDPRETRKAMAVSWARRTLGVDLPEDEADATAIGSWAIRKASERPVRPELPR